DDDVGGELPAQPVDDELGGLAVGARDRLVSGLAVHRHIGPVVGEGELSRRAREPGGDVQLPLHPQSIAARYDRAPSAIAFASTTRSSCVLVRITHFPGSICHPSVVSVSPGNTTPANRAAKL